MVDLTSRAPRSVPIIVGTRYRKNLVSAGNGYDWLGSSAVPRRETSKSIPSVGAYVGTIRVCSYARRGTGWKLRLTMTSGRGGGEELMVEQVERLGARRLAEIVVNHCQRDERLRQTVRIALAASAPSDTLVKMLATEIDAVRASRHFYGYRESNVLAQELDRIRQGISEYLLPAQPRAAAELLGRLIRLDANIYERSDDSDGVIGDAIGEAVTDCR